MCSQVTVLVAAGFSRVVTDIQIKSFQERMSCYNGPLLSGPLLSGSTLAVYIGTVADVLHKHVRHVDIDVQWQWRPARPLMEMSVGGRLSEYLSLL